MAKDYLTYINHLGQSFTFGERGLYIEESELHDWSNSYESKNGRVTRFYKDVFEKKLPVVVMADSEEEGKILRNKLYDVTSVDSESEEYGKLVYNGYEMKCYCTAAKHSGWLEYLAFGDIELTVVTDKPYWTKKTVKEFKAADYIAIETTEGGKGYPHGYEYNYGLAETNGIIYNPSALAINAEIKIFGYALHPEIKINGQSYKINYEIPQYCTATINTLDKTILLKSRNGSEKNLLAYRDNTESFKTIPSGMSTIYWDKSFDFNLTLIEKRGEPKWI